MYHFRSNLALFLLLISVLCGQVPTPFHRGVNLTNWFQQNAAQSVQLSQYTYDDLVDIKSLGVDVIRLPINLHAMTSGEPDYIVDPLLFYFLDQVVDWTAALDLHLILDNHSFDPDINTDVGIYNILLAVWPQLAEHFKERGPNLYYEILNEPHGISDIAWNTIQLNIVNAIRTVDSTHTIVVGPASWNSYNNLDEMPIYPDDNLIYTFHFYDPFLFTHQGASWTDPSMVPLAGVPFPYGAGAMPACPPELIGTYIQTELNNYSNIGTVSAIQNTLDIAVEFGVSRGVPIYCGEFGVLMDNADNDHRVAWYDVVASYLDSMDIGWTIWDYHGGFGVFEQGSSGLFDHDLNIPLIEALGFNTPPQTEFTLEADTTGFYLYEDYVSEHILSDHNIHGILNMYDTNDPQSGDYCIYWSQAQQYDIIGFRFSPYKDLSELVDENYVLTLWLKSSGTPTSFDLRFLDTKTAEPDDHPWRMGITLGPSDLQWSGTWQYLQLPLNDLMEKGSWDNAWFEPAGLFDWTAVDRFELVAEHSSWADTELWFDDIRVVDPVAAIVKNPEEGPPSFSLIKNYPNPFNAQTTIRYSLAERAFTELTIYDIQGRLVATPLAAYENAGLHELSWNTSGSNAESGVYVATLKVGRSSRMIKLLYLK